MRSDLLYLLLLVGPCLADNLVYDAICLDEEEDKLRFANESCKTDKDCYNYVYNSTACKNGMCTCQEDFVMAKRITSSGTMRLICSPAPTLNKSCDTTCKKPLQCVSASGNIDPAMNDIGPQKICQCLPPYQEMDGTCALECTDDNIYFEGQCRKRCAANEVFLDDGSCKKMGNLGDPCMGESQCATPFAECKNGVCTCMSGFSPNDKNDACETTAYSCPTGDPAKINGTVVSCEIVSGSKKMPADYLSPGLSDTCSNDQYCLVLNGNSSVKGSTGFCCPLPTKCPIGNPHPTATCNQVGSTDESCPKETHTCRNITFANTGVASLCCPDQCHSTSVLINNRCYPKRRYGDQCDYDQQCSNFNGICENGKCTCPQNTQTQPAGPYTYCRLICKEGEETGTNGQCAPIVSLGDKCDPSLPEQCPPNSHCSPISSTCICDCGQQVKLDSRTCGPQPNCRVPYEGPSKLADAKIDPSSATFCIPHGTENPLLKSAVKECPSDQYCHAYLNDLGICCQRPAQLKCMDGVIGKGTCNIELPKSCADDQYCSKPLDSVGINDYNQGICCQFLVDQGDVTSSP